MIDYPITETFISLQGEGRWVGYPAFFIRLAGCSLWGSGKCRLGERCDTEPSKVARRAGADWLGREAHYALPGGIAVITGGEPTDYNIVPLVAALRDHGMRVHLETSGERETPEVDWLTVSPKTLEYRQRSGHAWKFVVMPGMTARDIGEWDSGQFMFRYLQPLTIDGAPANLTEVIGMVKASNGRYALSIQAHRAWGLP